MLEFLSGMPSNITPIERMLALEQRFFLTDHNLTYTDKMSMAVGVEVRVPFLDLDLIDFASHIPSKFKQRNSVGKWILKKLWNLICLMMLYIGQKVALALPFVAGLSLNYVIGFTTPFLHIVFREEAFLTLTP